MYIIQVSKYKNKNEIKCSNQIASPLSNTHTHTHTHTQYLEQSFRERRKNEQLIDRNDRLVDFGKTLVETTPKAPNP
jgi:hypothetical protein